MNYRTGPTNQDILRLFQIKGQQLNHFQIAEQVGKPSWRVCQRLNTMEKQGLIVCLRRSERGKNPTPGLWARQTQILKT